MGHIRLKLVAPADSATSAAAATTESPATLAILRPDPRRLHLVDADTGTPPDDAA